MPGFFTDGELASDPGSIFDYDVTAGEAFGSGFGRQFDTNPLALVARQARYLNDDLQNIAGGGVDWVDAEKAAGEVQSRGLDLKIPKGGIARHELDMLQYLKQREIEQNTTSARTRGVGSAAAGFAGGLAASLTDPINVASGFIPIVNQVRYAQWLARAGEGVFARAAVRAGAGAIEGAVGAAIIEPIVYAGATSEQLDYGLMDSFLNVTLGGVLGGGLHVIGGAVYDRAGRGAGAPDVEAALRDAAANMPEATQREMFQSAVAAIERGEPVDVVPVVAKQAEVERAVAGQLMLGDRSRAPDVANPATAAQNKAPNRAAMQEALARANETLEYKAKNGRSSDLFNEGFAFRSAEDLDAELKRAPASAAAAVEAYGKAVGWEVFLDGASPTSTYLFFRRKSDVKDADGFPVNIEFKVRISDHANIGVNRNPPDINYAPGVEGFEDVIRKIDNARIANADDVADGETPEISFDVPSIRQAGQRNLADLIDQSRADRTQEAFNRQFVDKADEVIAAEKARPKDKIESVKQDEAEFRDMVEEYRGQGRLTTETVKVDGREVLSDVDRLKQADELAAWAERRAKAFEAAAGCIEAA